MTYLLILAALPTLWVFFLAYSAIKPRWKSLRPEVKLVAAIVVLIGGAIDIFLNWTGGWILGIPRELTLSQRCAKLRKTDMGWRGDVAQYLCDNWTNPFDPEHC
jgi:hypothetical protein